MPHWKGGTEITYLESVSKDGGMMATGFANASSLIFLKAEVKQTTWSAFVLGLFVFEFKTIQTPNLVLATELKM